MKIISSIISNEYIISKICDNYNIKNLMSCKLLNTSHSDIYKLETSKEKYIFKIYAYGTKTKHELDFEIEFVNYLYTHNICVPRYIETIYKDCILSINAIEGERYAILMEYLNGIEIDYSTDNNAFLYGTLVANFHLVSENFHSPTSKQKKFDFHSILQNAIVNIESFLLEEYPNDITEFHHFFELITSKWDNLNFEKLKKINCHGDFHGGNIFQYLGQYFFYDFDFSAFGYEIYDLSVFKWACLIGKRESHWDLFLNGYRSIRQIEISDEILILFVALRDIWIMSNHIELIDTRGSLYINKYYIEGKKIFIYKLSKILNGG